MRFNIKVILVLMLYQSLVLATPETSNFQAHISKPDGTDLESNAVTFTFKYLNEAGTCTLYTETYAGVDMSGSGGDVSIQLGSGAPSFPVAGFSLKDILSNATTNTMNCVEGGNYTPTLPTEKRKFVVEFSYAGSNGTQTLPAADINSVPYSMYAGDAANLGGFAANTYARFADVSTCAGGQFLTFNGTVFSCAAPGAPVNFTGALSGDVTGTQSATVVSSLRGRPLSVAAPASGEVLTFDGTTWVPMGVAGAAGGTVTSVTSANLYLSVASSSTTPVLTVNVGQAANTVAAGDDARIVGAWQAGSALSGDVTGTLAANVVSTVGGKTAAQVNTSVNDTLAATSLNTPSTIVKRDASGDVTVSRASAVDFSGRNFLFYDSGVNKITVKSPNALTSGDYTLTLPDGTGTNGYVLSTNGAGVTSWIPAATGSVTNVTATAPVQSSGGATPNISLAKSTAGADGYLASTDWTIFNNKQNTLVKATAVADGYLASTDWTTFNNKQNTLVKATAVADGYLASTDWTTFNNKQNTLVKATAVADGYLSSTDFSSFANKVSSQWTTSSDSTIIYYNGGNVGIGTTTPTTELMVIGTHGAGSTLSTAGAGARMFYYPRKAAFRAGSVTGAHWDNANVGSYSFAVGSNTTASGNWSVAMGFNTVSSGQASTAMGFVSTASADYSMAMGGGTVASGQFATAMGANSKATSTYSTSMGDWTTASGQASTAMGESTIASGDMSLAAGFFTTAESYSQTTIGAYNLPKGGETAGAWVATDPLFVVGNGTGVGSESNAMMILKNGNVGIGTTVPTANLDVRAYSAANPPAGEYILNVDGGFAPLAASKSIRLVASQGSAGGFPPPGDGGDIIIQSGNGGTGGGVAGNINITGGDGDGGGGNVVINAGENGNIILGDIVGKVGIGMAAPAFALDVSGDASITGNISVGSTSEGITAYVNSGAGYTIPDTSVNIRRITLTANTTITLPAFANAGRVYAMTLFIKQDGFGGRTISYAGNGGDTIKWDSGVAPTISPTADKITIIQLTKPGDEAVWYGSMTWKEN